MAPVLPYHGLAYRQNPSFYSRPQFMEQIITQLERDASRRLTSFALLGFGGCGKTQLAIEYAYLTNFYDIILWCTAENSLRLCESFTTHARGLGLIKGDEAPHQDRVTSLIKKQLLYLSAKGFIHWIYWKRLPS
jgi:hypothetical protein